MKNPRGKQKRKKKLIPVDTYNVLTAMEFDRMSPEMKVSRKLPKYGQWLTKQLLEKGRITVKYATEAAAFELGVGVETIRRSWLGYYTTSERCEFKVIYDEEADCNFVTLRNASSIGINIEDIVGSSHRHQ